MTVQMFTGLIGRLLRASNFLWSFTGVDTITGITLQLLMFGIFGIFSMGFLKYKKQDFIKNNFKPIFTFT